MSIKTKLKDLSSTALGTISLNGFIQGYCVAVDELLRLGTREGKTHAAILFDAQLRGLTRKDLKLAGVTVDNLVYSHWQMLNS